MGEPENTQLPGVMVDEVIDKSLDFKPSRFVHSTIGYHQIAPTNNTSTFTLDASSVTDVEFLIPSNRVFNLSKTALNFRLKVNQAAAGKFNVVHAGCLFDSIHLLSRNGKSLCHLTYADFYSRVVAPAMTRMDDFVNRDIATTETSSADIRTTTSGWSPSGTIGLPLANANVAEGVANGNPHPSVEDFFGSSINEPRWAFFNTTAASESHIRYNAKLSELFPGTVFSIEQNLLVPEPLILRISYNPLSKIGFQPLNTNAYPADHISAAGTVAVTGGSINDLRLDLAIEKSQSVMEGLRQLMNSGGITLTVPFAMMKKQSVTSTTISLQERINRAYGKRLNYIWTSVFNGVSKTLDKAYDNANITSATSYVPSKVKKFQTLMNAEPLQQNVLDVAKSEDYSYMRDAGYFKGSVIRTSRQFAANWFWCDNFTGAPFALSDSQADSGLNIETGELTYQFNVTDAAGTALDYVTIVGSQKVLTITPTEIDIR